MPGELVDRIGKAVWLLGRLAEGSESIEGPDIAAGCREIVAELEAAKVTELGLSDYYAAGDASRDLVGVAEWLRKNPSGLDSRHVTALFVVAELLARAEVRE